MSTLPPGRAAVARPEARSSLSMCILDRYIAREILAAWLTILLILLVIVLGTEVVHLLSWITQGFIPVSAFLAYLVNSLFEFSMVLIPLSLLLGILSAFGRLYRDSEMAAMMAAGVGPWQWYRPLLGVVIPVVILLFVLTLFVRPQINTQRALLNARISSQAEIDTLLVGQFNHTRHGGGVLFPESQDASGALRNTFFEQRKNGYDQVNIAASTSSMRNDEGLRYMLMRNGVYYAGNAGSPEMKIIEYREYGMYLDRKSPSVRFDAEDRSPGELWRSSSLADRAELQWRLAIPVATFIVALIALPLSKVNPRSGRYARLGLALVIYLLYSNLLNVAVSWIEQGRVSEWLAPWVIHLAAIVFWLLLLRRSGFWPKTGRRPA